LQTQGAIGESTNATARIQRLTAVPQVDVLKAIRVIKIEITIGWAKINGERSVRPDTLLAWKSRAEQTHDATVLKTISLPSCETEGVYEGPFGFPDGDECELECDATRDEVPKTATMERSCTAENLFRNEGRTERLSIWVGSGNVFYQKRWRIGGMKFEVWDEEENIFDLGHTLV
jgi:hypothetical protein